VSRRLWQDHLRKYLRCKVQTEKRGRGGALVCPQPVSQGWITREFLPWFQQEWDAYQKGKAEGQDDLILTLTLQCGCKLPVSAEKVAAIIWSPGHRQAS